MEKISREARWTIWNVFRWRGHSTDKTVDGECAAIDELAGRYRKRQEALAEKGIKEKEESL